MGLPDDLRQHVTRVSQQLAYVRNEDQTKTSLILPFIRLLGYDVFDATEVVPEYAADFGTKSGEKIDYVVMREGKPALLIEAKSARTALHVGHASQLYRYYSTMDTRIGILTNGKSYQFFADLNKSNVMDREPFIVMDLLEFDERMIGVVEGLTKGGFNPELVLARARALNIRREIQARFRREFDAPSPDLVKHFARGLYEGVFNNEVETEFAPIVKQEWRDLWRAQERANSPAADPPAPEVTTNPENISAPMPAYKAGNLLEIPIFAERAGERIDRSDAILIFDRSNTRKSKIRFGGDEVSVNNAYLRAIRLVRPNYKSPSGRGWYDWKLSDPATGELRSIHDLRHDEELLRRILDNAK